MDDMVQSPYRVRIKRSFDRRYSDARLIVWLRKDMTFWVQPNPLWPKRLLRKDAYGWFYYWYGTKTRCKPVVKARIN